MPPKGYKTITLKLAIFRALEAYRRIHALKSPGHAIEELLKNAA